VTARRAPLTHDAEHARVALDVGRYDAAPRRTGRDRLARREHYKRAVLALRWHLGRSHGYRHVVGTPPTLADLQALHAAHHEGATP